MFIKPRTARSRNSVASELMLQDDTRDRVGEATWFICGSWNHSFADKLDAVLLFFEGRDDAATAKVWIDMLVTSHHAFEPSKPTEWWMHTLCTTIRHMGRLLLVVDQWDNPTALRRAW
jgi:hypothetical protein